MNKAIYKGKELSIEDVAILVGGKVSYEFENPRVYIFRASELRYFKIDNGNLLAFCIIRYSKESKTYNSQKKYLVEKEMMARIDAALGLVQEDDE